jgi:PadR family transcriptional regulator PadR
MVDIGKDLVAASATPLILAILAEGESYGYAILKQVSDLSDGAMEWTDGMLYPVLHRLERQGHIEGRWGESEIGRKRRYYRLTAGGAAELATQRAQWQAVDAALRRVWSAPTPRRTPRSAQGLPASLGAA